MKQGFCMRQKGASFNASRRLGKCHAQAVTEVAKSTTEELEKKQVVSYQGVDFLVDDNPELKSTWKQRATVAGSATLMSLLLAQGFAHSDNLMADAISMLAAYVVADGASGIYHFLVDNYGSSNTPVFGTQIAAFQGHHQRPWTITQREFCNNCSLTFAPAGTAAAVCLGLSSVGVTSSSFDVFMATAIFFVAMSQQFHAWSHMKKSQLPAAVVSLQDANLVISRKAHGAHHKSPFNVNYCIVSGWCNPVLDAGFFYALETAIHRATGVEPRGWSEPSAEWRELSPDEVQ